MKKLLTLVVSLVMIIGSMTLFACDSSFDGNYKEVTTAEAQSFVNEAKNAEKAATEIIFGMEMSAKVSVKGKDEAGKDIEGKITAEAKSGVVNENEFKLAAKAEISTSGIAEADAYNGKFEAYATDGKIYLKAALKDKDEMKMSADLGLDQIKAMMNPDAMSAILGNSVGMLEMALQMVDNLDQVQAMLGDGVIKFYIDADAHKIKIELNVNANTLSKDAKAMVEEVLGLKGLDVSGNVFLAFDDNYNFTGIKVDVKVKTSEMEVSAEVSLKAYSGSVSVPSKFEGYEEGDLWKVFLPN